MSAIYLAVDHPTLRFPVRDSYTRTLLQPSTIGASSYVPHPLPLKFRDSVSYLYDSSSLSDPLVSDSMTIALSIVRWVPLNFFMRPILAITSEYYKSHTDYNPLFSDTEVFPTGRHYAVSRTLPNRVELDNQPHSQSWTYIIGQFVLGTCIC